MPMKSQKQRSFLWSQHPDIAKKFETETPDGKKLPEYVSKARKSVIDKRMRG